MKCNGKSSPTFAIRADGHWRVLQNTLSTADLRHFGADIDLDIGTTKANRILPSL